jgi:hypothetical protein
MERTIVSTICRERERDVRFKTFTLTLSDCNDTNGLVRGRLRQLGQAAQPGGQWRAE